MDPFASQSAESLLAKSRAHHYYGDIERTLFILGGLVMLVGLFFFYQYLPFPSYISLLAIVILVIIAGLLSPRQKWLAVVNMVIAALGSLIFGLQAFVTRLEADMGYFPAALPWVNLAIALIFLFALYFSTKTLRWRFAKGKERLWEKKEDGTTPLA
jgi:hypothetical protein